MTIAQRRRDERGVTAVLTAIMAVVLLSIMAFVSDFGFAYANQRRIQNGADAAALAVGKKIAAESLSVDDCTLVRTKFNTALSRSYALSVFRQSADTTAALATGATGFDVSCETVAGTSGTAVVKVRGEQDSPSFLGGLFGVTKVPVAQQARAIVAPVGGAVGLRPFAICRVFAEAIQNAPSTTFVVPITNADTGCGSASGNWAMLDFNGGSNPTGDMKSWILNGYDQELSVASPLTLAGDPGFNVNAATTEMDAMMTLNDIVLPVYTSVTGSGNNTQYTISGFLAVTPCRYSINNKSGPAPASVNPLCGALPLTPPSDYLQVRYSGYIPVGSLNLKCKLADNACDHGPRAVTLAD